MADVVTSTTISDGEREAVMRFTYQYVDGDNESAVTKVDVSALQTNSNGDTCSAVRIVEIWYAVVGMTAMLESDATVDVTLLNLPADKQGI